MHKFKHILFFFNKIFKLKNDKISDYSKERFIKKLSIKIFLSSFIILLIISPILFLLFFLDLYFENLFKEIISLKGIFIITFTSIIYFYVRLFLKKFVS